MNVVDLVKAIGYVKASNTAINNQFGASVALSKDGKTLAVGAPQSAGAAKGEVYVFMNAGGVWGPGDALVKGGKAAPVAGDNFGYSVALSDDGKTLAVGADTESNSATGISSAGVSDGLAAGSGAVYVFTNSGVWGQDAYVKASNTDGGDSFGHSVALSGDGKTLAVGATGESSNAKGIGGNQADNSEAGSGAVYLY